MVGQLPEPENGLTFWDATGGAAEKFLGLVDAFTIYNMMQNHGC